MKLHKKVFSDYREFWLEQDEETSRSKKKRGSRRKQDRRRMSRKKQEDKMMIVIFTCGKQYKTPSSSLARKSTVQFSLRRCMSEDFLSIYRSATTTDQILFDYAVKINNLRGLSIRNKNAIWAKCTNAATHSSNQERAMRGAPQNPMYLCDF